MDVLQDTRRSGFTFAPEAATERMRNIINKAVPQQQVIDTAREVYSRGWVTIKLYFMIGHPSETLEDVQAIIDLAKAVLAEGRRIHGRKATVTGREHVRPCRTRRSSGSRWIRWSRSAPSKPCSSSR